MSKIFNISKQEAESKLDRIDKEQQFIFKKVFKKKDVYPEGFDLVINFDYMSEPQWAAQIVATAFLAKFGSELTRKQKKIEKQNFIS